MTSAMQFFGGKPLIIGGKLALDPACCCVTATHTPFTFSPLFVTFEGGTEGGSGDSYQQDDYDVYWDDYANTLPAARYLGVADMDNGGACTPARHDYCAATCFYSPLLPNTGYTNPCGPVSSGPGPTYPDPGSFTCTNLNLHMHNTIPKCLSFPGNHKLSIYAKNVRACIPYFNVSVFGLYYDTFYPQWIHQGMFFYGAVCGPGVAGDNFFLNFLTGCTDGFSPTNICCLDSWVVCP